MAYGRESFPLWGGAATLLTVDPSGLRAARGAVDRVVAEIDVACNPYRGDSELTRVNRSAGTVSVVSSTFLAVLQAALGAARASGGLVDPTVPGMTAGWRTVQVDPVRRTVIMPRGTALDFGAIGKAYAADLAATQAAEAAGCGVLVAVAGDIAVRGPVPEGGWPVRVPDNHRTGPGGGLPPGQDITLHGPGGLATSSLAVRVRKPGRTAAHILDPRTGRPVEGPWRTASVAAGSCVEATMASTAALVMGHRAGTWLTGCELPSRLIHTDGWTLRIGGWPVDPMDLGMKVAG